jgi:hypothetical protein
MKKKLSNVDIVSINCVDPTSSAHAIYYSRRNIEFGKSILITHEDIDLDDIELHRLDKLDWNGYNDRVLNLKEHTNNDYVLLIQDDGHVVNPMQWTDEFLNYDYVGAPWPFEDSWVEKQPEKLRPYLRKNFPKNRVGNGGFSLRSKKFLEFSSQYDSCDEWGEDIFLCNIKYDEAIAYGIKFAPFDLAVKFSYENPLIELGDHWDNFNTEFFGGRHFGWHGKNFSNTQELMDLKYLT